MTTETTTTYREFTDAEFGDTLLILNTGPSVDGNCRMSLVNERNVRTCSLSEHTARLLGVSLLAWSGPTTGTLEPVEFKSETYLDRRLDQRKPMHHAMVMVTDGEPSISVGGSTVTLDFEGDVIDLATRLIVWAGVATEPIASAR
jgi:hypothetical protein